MRWVANYYAGDLMKYGCSCCSNPTMRWRTKTFRWRWMARFVCWWVEHGPVLGMQVMVGGYQGMYNPFVSREKKTQ